ncbi:unnamed protein product [Tenebrio molitor]|nr:unnamed protein product [Tenebrio molitor]
MQLTNMNQFQFRVFLQIKIPIFAEISGRPFVLCRDVREGFME